MRMRHKKNLEERLENVSDILFSPKRENLNYNEKEEKIIDFKSIFGNDNPIYLEVGCGCGGFGCQFAKQNPNTNIICVEKVKNVIVVGCEKAKSKNLKNIRFLNTSAEYLLSYIEKNSIETIFLNFSCPFPKKKYAAHRLTNGRFLEIYKKLLKENAPIFQKTDNMHFFEYSIEEFSKSGFELSNISLDLHNSNFEGNIITEYEKKFSDEGFPIYRLEARVKRTEL